MAHTTAHSARVFGPAEVSEALARAGVVLVDHGPADAAVVVGDPGARALHAAREVRAGGGRLVVVGAGPASDEADAVFAELPPTAHLVAALAPPVVPTRVPLEHGVLDLDDGVFVVGTERRELRPREVELLRWLGARPGQVVSRETLLAEVWGYSTRAVSRAVDATVARLRQTIERDAGRPQHLLTVRGVGFRFEPRAAAPAATHPAPEPLLGRGPLLAEIRDRLQAGARLITLKGPAGVGKTRCLEHLDAGPRRVLRCFAEGIDDVGAALAAIAGAVGVRVRAIGPGLVDVLARELDTTETVLALDDLDHLADRIGPELTRLLHAAPRLAIVCTSREVLRVAGEQVVEVPPLPTEIAGALLRRRAHEAGVDVPLEDATRVAARLDGLPLEIELAAGLLEVLSPDQVVARLAHPLESLVGLERDRPTRHQSLRAAIASSWALLDDDHRRALCVCAVFRGRIHVDAAEAVLDSPSALGWLRGLRGKSLLRTSAPGTLEMSTAVRSFALGEVDEPTQRQTRVALARWYATRVRARCPLGEVPGRDTMAWMIHDLANLRGALETARHEAPALLASLAGGLYHVLAVRGPVQEALDVLDAATLHGGVTDQRDLAELHRARAAVLLLLERPGDVERAVHAAVEAARGLDAPRIEGRAWAHLGSARLDQGRAEEATEALERATVCLRRAGDRDYLAMTLANLAGSCWDIGRGAAAGRHYAEATSVASAGGNPRLQALTRVARGLFLLESGQLEVADDLEEALHIHRASGDRLNLALGLEALARGYLALGQIDAAVRALDEAATLRRAWGAVHPPAVVWQIRGVTQVATGRFHEAIDSFERAAEPLGDTELARYLVAARRLAALLSGRHDPTPLPDAVPGGRAARARAVCLALDAHLAGDPATMAARRREAVEPADGLACRYADVVPLVAALDQVVAARSRDA